MFSFSVHGYTFTLNNQPDNKPVHKPDFELIQWFAQRAAAAYMPAGQIKQHLPGVEHIAVAADTDVQYFVEIVDETTQLVAIRGTANLANALCDARFFKHRDSELGIQLHRGFHSDAEKVLEQITPLLDPGKTVLVTGHSLGAAIATIIMMYLSKRGWQVAFSVNFGQPKITNKAGCERYADLPLLRIADKEDVVPMVPFANLADLIHGEYHHFAPELLLLNAQYYVYQTAHQQWSSHANSFWRNLGDESVTDHYMQHYLDNIAPKLGDAQAVTFEERERYS